MIRASADPWSAHGSIFAMPRPGEGRRVSATSERRSRVASYRGAGGGAASVVRVTRQGNVVTAAWRELDECALDGDGF